MEFNTIAVSDGITMGTEGMKASLVSRELIADSMELMARAYFFDALVTVVACDKTIPAGAMALLRTNLPGLLVYGGSIMPGRLGDRDLTIQDVYEAVGAHAAGKIDDEELKAIEDFACPGAGACGGRDRIGCAAVLGWTPGRHTRCPPISVAATSRNTQWSPFWA